MPCLLSARCLLLRLLEGVGGFLLYAGMSTGVSHCSRISPSFDVNFCLSHKVLILSKKRFVLISISSSNQVKLSVSEIIPTFLVIESIS
jgi:hypothetical protein